MPLFIFVIDNMSNGRAFLKEGMVGWKKAARKYTGKKTCTIRVWSQCAICGINTCKLSGFLHPYHLDEFILHIKLSG